MTIKTTGDKMKVSIRRKIISTVVVCFLVLTVLLVSASIFSISDVLDDDSSEILRLKCSESAQQINEELRNIEQSVDTMSSQLVSWLGENDELLDNEELFDEYMAILREFGRNAIENTHGALGTYLRFDPSVKKNGDFFWVRDRKGEVVDTELTDINAYSKDDFEHVGWYYTPLEAHNPVWLDPYHNKNIGYDMISYIVPLYRKDGEPLGIIGMDINITLLNEFCANVRVYDSGDALIIDSNGDLIYKNSFTVSGDSNFKYGECYYGAVSDKVITADHNGRKLLIMSQMLDNNMQFFIRVPKDEINAPKRRLISMLLVIACAFSLTAVFIMFKWANSITRPLLELTEKAKKIAENELDTDLTCKTGDEVEVLSESLEKMVGSLKKHIDYINGLAYIEPMTKLGNSLAYKKKLEALSADTANGNADFTIFVMDLNGLKRVNDNYGHEKGDAYIKNAADIIRSVFGEKNSFRIGGDEFAAVLDGMSEDDISALTERLNSAMDGFNTGKTEIYDQVHIGIGGSSYRSGEDKETSDVFRRADSMMYEDKKRKKAAMEKSFSV